MFMPSVNLFPSVSFTVSNKTVLYQQHIYIYIYNICASSLVLFLNRVRVSIVGDSFNSNLVAIVSVDPDVMKDWAASQGIKVLLLLT